MTKETEKKAIKDLRDGVVELTSVQIDYIRDRFGDKLHEAINDKINIETTYNVDIWKKIKKLTSPNLVLNGEYTADDFYNDMFDMFYSDEDFILEFINDYLYYNDLLEIVNVEADDVEILPDELLSEC